MVKEKINSINKIVNYLYENDVKGVKILQIEQEFDKYFCDVAKSIYEHNRMQKVVSRIFQVDEELIIKQKNIFLDFGEELNVQRGWFLEAYGDEYKARVKYKDAQTCYWEALDEYIVTNTL